MFLKLTISLAPCPSNVESAALVSFIIVGGKAALMVSKQ